MSQVRAGGGGVVAWGRKVGVCFGTFKYKVKVPRIETSKNLTLNFEFESINSPLTKLKSLVDNFNFGCEGTNNLFL